METEVLEKVVENQVAESQENDETPAWFQDFIEHHDFESPKRGDILEGEVLDIRDNSILIDVGLKRDAIVTSQDLDKVNDEILENIKVGDEVLVSVFKTPVGDEDLLVSLNQGIAYKNWLKAEEYLEGSELLDLEIIEQNKGGLLVNFENLRGFVPNSHIPALRRGASHQKMEEIKTEMIGKRLPLKVIEVNRKQRRLVFSARVAQKEQRANRLKELEVGKIIKSRVVNVVDFGVFVDLQGVDGLVHKSEIAWDRVYNPSKHFNVGDEIEVKIVEVDVEKERVSLSRKALLSNPWDALREKYNDGDLIEGKVVSVLDFGAFIELPEGLQGLVHVSELGYANMGDPKSVVRAGDNVLVRVMNIDPSRERISLSMRRVPISEQLTWMVEEEMGAEPVEAEEEPTAANAVEVEPESPDVEDAEPVEAEEEPTAEDAVEVEPESPDVEDAEPVEAEEEPTAEDAVEVEPESPQAVESDLLNLNTADTAALTDLPGVGPALAERIVENRPYAAIEDLTAVKGIGAKALGELSELVTV